MESIVYLDNDLSITSFPRWSCYSAAHGLLAPGLLAPGLLAPYKPKSQLDKHNLQASIAKQVQCLLAAFSWLWKGRQPFSDLKTSNATEPLSLGCLIPGSLSTYRTWQSLPQHVDPFQFITFLSYMCIESRFVGGEVHVVSGILVLDELRGSIERVDVKPRHRINSSSVFNSGRKAIAGRNPLHPWRIMGVSRGLGAGGWVARTRTHRCRIARWISVLKKVMYRSVGTSLYKQKNGTMWA